MQDERLPADTLFLVFEEDFRFWPDDQEPTAWAMEVGDDAAEPTAAAEPSSSSCAAAAKKKSRPPRAKGYWWEIKEQGRKSDDVIPGPGVPPEVADCVRYSILAERHHAGDLMWMGYQCLGKRKTMIFSGTAFLMVTQFAASILEKAMRRDECERDHIDRSFKAWLLRRPETQKKLASHTCIRLLEVLQSIFQKSPKRSLAKTVKQSRSSKRTSGINRSPAWAPDAATTPKAEASGCAR